MLVNMRSLDISILHNSNNNVSLFCNLFKSNLNFDFFIQIKKIKTNEIVLKMIYLIKLANKNVIYLSRNLICSLNQNNKIILMNQNRFNLFTSKNISTSTVKWNDESTVNNRDQPVKYSTSKAKTYDSINTFSNRSGRTKPKSEPFIIIFSTMIFFIYFALIREENEMDEIFSRSLEDSVPNIRIMSLRQQIAQ
jgi:hypothetical protein